MDKILDISDIFGLNLVSLGVTVILVIIVGFVAIFRANRKNVTFTNKPTTKKSVGKESRKLDNNVINESGKKKKRATNEKEAKTNNSVTVKKETKNSSPKKQSNTATPVNTKTKQKEPVKDVKTITPKPKKTPVVPDPIEDDGWQTVTKKQKKQNEPVKAAAKENLKTSPKKSPTKNKSVTTNANKISPPTTPERLTEINSETPVSETTQVQDPEWTENKPTKKNKKRALRE